MKADINRVSWSTSIAALCGVLACVAGSVQATEVYRWVDADGVVHFSQTAPAADVANVSREVVENPVPSGYDPEQDLYDVAGQQERMQARREELEREREERRQRQAAQSPVRSAQPVQGYPAYGWPLYGSRPPNRPWPPVEPPIEPPVERPRPPSTLRPPGAGPQ